MNIDTVNNSFSYSVWPALSNDTRPAHSNTISENNKNSTAVQSNTEKKNKSDRNDRTENSRPASPRIVGENTGELTEAEIALIKELEQIDDAVRKHEMAHVAAGAGHIISGANFSYKTGPDGKRYAVAGEVRIDTSPVSGDPEATIRKMRQVRNAALAPADPSTQDRRVAAAATAISTEAMTELITKRTEERNESDEKKAFGNLKKTAGNAYSKASNMTETQRQPFFKISA